MQNEVKLGELCGPTAQRDAIHIAVAPVVAGEELSVGQPVSLCDGKAVEDYENPIGIVDPFLKAAVQPEQTFYLCLYPYTITSLRHEWVHPAFDAKTLEQKAASLAWMEAFAKQHHSHRGRWYDGMGRNYTAADLIEAATDFLHTGNRHIQQGSSSLRDDAHTAEFWTHFEVITGICVPDRSESPFCCTC